MKKKSLFMMLLLMLIAFMPLKAEAKVKLNASKKTITINQKYRLALKGTGGKVTWSSSNSSICTVSGKGTICGKKSGTAYVTAQAGGKRYSCKVKVIVPSISASMTVKKGKKKTIPIKNKKKFSKITYKSCNKKIATVTKNGVVKGIKKGVATIKVRFNKSYTVKVTVKVGFTKTSSTVNVMRGSSKKLTPKTSGAGGTYRVSNPAMGYVVNGVYYSKGYGINTVTYNWKNYCHVFTVKNFCWEAHRGYSVIYPDNSLEAIEAAKKAGADSIEIDVRATKDGQFVVYHDSSLEGATNNSVAPDGSVYGYVRRYTLEDLQVKDIIYKDGVYYRLASLDEALALANKLGLNVSIEMKKIPSKESYSYMEKTQAEIVQNLCATIKKYQNGNSLFDIIVTSADNAQLLIDNSDHSIIVRVTSESYNENADLRELASKYSFIMSSSEFARKYYNNCLATQNYPF